MWSQKVHRRNSLQGAVHGLLIDKQLYIPIHCELCSAQHTDIRFDKHAPSG